MLVIVLAVACGRSTPSAPTAVDNPPPKSGETVAADGLTLTVYGCDASDSNCQYSFSIENTGTGCAENVHGTIMQTSWDGQATSTSNWSWTGVLHPGERSGVDGCCIAGSGRYSVQVSSASATCP